MDRGVPSHQTEHQQDLGSAAMLKLTIDGQRRPGDVPPDFPSDKSGIRVTSFALVFAAVLCVTVIGFVSTIRLSNPNSADYGYDEALAAQTSFLSGARLPFDCSDAASVEAPRSALDFGES